LNLSEECWKPALQITPEAYDCFLRANSLAPVDTLSPQECELAIGLYEKAVRLDPKFVQAYIALSVFHSAVYHAGIDRTEARLAKSKAAADRALELAPDLPGGKEALAYYYYWGYLDYDRALEILESVRRARPNNPPTLIGFIQRRKGKWTDALGILEDVFKLNPRDSEAASEIALTNMSMRKYEDAESWEDRSLSLNPQRIQAKADKARILYLRTGTTEEARALVKALTPGPWSDYLGVLLEMADRNWKSVLDKLDSISLDSFDVFSLCYFDKNLAYAQAFFAQKDSSNTRRCADLARAA